MISAIGSIIVGKWHWITDMLKSAENKEPVGYFAATICVVVSILVGSLLVRNFYRMVLADPNKPYEGFGSTLSAVLFLAVFVYIGFELIRRLVS